MSEVGKRIKAYLDKNGIKQSFVSEQSKIKQTALNEMLNSRRRVGAEEYFKICDALNVPLDHFRKEV